MCLFYLGCLMYFIGEMLFKKYINLGEGFEYSLGCFLLVFLVVYLVCLYKLCR